MILKRALALSTLFLTGCSFSQLLQGNVFLDVWENNASEYFWQRYDVSLQESTRDYFSEWASGFEKKRDTFVRKDEDGVLQGSTIILGRNLAQNRAQYQKSLQKLETIIQLQENIKKQTGKICEFQKSSVKCDL